MLCYKIFVNLFYNHKQTKGHHDRFRTLEGNVFITGLH